VLPDITTLGKVIGGGLPVGAFGGTAAIMDRVTPDGDIFVAGTLSGNPVAMAAGIATLGLLSDATFDRLSGLGRRLCAGLGKVFARHGVPHTLDAEGSMFGLFFSAGPVTDLAGAKRADAAFYARFFHAMLERGFYFAPSPFEAAFLSLAHTDALIDETIAAPATRWRRCARAASVSGPLAPHAPVDVRERHAFSPSTMGEALVALRDYEAVREALMLQTCGGSRSTPNWKTTSPASPSSKRSSTLPARRRERHGVVHVHAARTQAIEHLLRVSTDSTRC